MKRKARQWPIIRVIQRKSKTVWEVDTGYVVQPRIRKKFDDESLAATFAEKLKVRRANEGVKAFELSVAQRHDAQDALGLLADLKVTLKEAALFYRRHAQVATSIKTVREVWEEMLDFKERIQKKRRTYTQGLRCRLKHFVDEFGAQPIGDVTSSELQEWLYRDRTITDLTRKNAYAILSVLFGFAQGKRNRRRPTAPPYRLDNPVEGVARPDFLVEPPRILSVPEAKRLLNVAQKTNPTLKMLPYVVLASFCGVRAAELQGLWWDDLNFRKKQVTIPARIAKKRRLRNIPVPANAMAWLQPFKGFTGKIAPSNCAHRLTDLVKEAGFEKWPKNGLRHSFGSYQFALTDNAAETAARLGHKDDAVLFDHYRALADKIDAKQYFAIMPGTKKTTGTRKRA